MAEKNLNGSGLNEVWVRAAQLVKKFTGEVNLTKGDLQTQVNKKISGTDDTKNNIVTFTSGDTANPTAFKDVAVLASNENHKSILEKISNMFNNVRYLYKNVGGIKGLSSSSAITNEGQYALDAREKNASVDGTLANEINKLNSNFNDFPQKIVKRIAYGQGSGFTTSSIPIQANTNNAGMYLVTMFSRYEEKSDIYLLNIYDVTYALHPMVKNSNNMTVEYDGNNLIINRGLGDIW
ncbi:MAG: hypothetical protein II193_06170, partial [Lachnospiraceae bacterium]|nr:hypothetical protein [Lachnospiraceae bacterium]